MKIFCLHFLRSQPGHPTGCNEKIIITRLREDNLLVQSLSLTYQVTLGNPFDLPEPVSSLSKIISANNFCCTLYSLQSPLHVKYHLILTRTIRL